MKTVNYSNSQVFFAIYNHTSALWAKCGFQAAIVGGLVRDLVMAAAYVIKNGGSIWDYFDPKDYDFVVFTDDVLVMAEKIRSLGLGYDIHVEQEFGVVKFKTDVKMEDGSVITVDIDACIPRIEEYDDVTRRPRVRYAGEGCKTFEECLEKEYLRRDFCCNALYLLCGLKLECIFNSDGTLNFSAIFDPSKRGVRDIIGVKKTQPAYDSETDEYIGDEDYWVNERQLNWCREPKTTISQDSVRVLRGIGFVFRKGFRLSDEAEKGLKENLYIFINSIGTKKCSWNKIKDELNKVFSKAKGIAVSRYLRRLHDLGILKHILPEVEDMWDFDQKNPHHSKTLEWHTLDAIVASLNLFDEEGEKYFSQRADLDDDTISLGHYTNDCDTPLRAMVVWSILFHDAAKCSKEEEFACQTFDEEGIAHYHHHAEKSAEMAKKRLAILTLSGKEIEIITHLITNHMCLKDGGWDSKEIISTSTLKRKRRDNFILNHGDTHVDLQRLTLCIIYGDDLNHMESTDKKVRGFESRWNEYISTRKPEPKIRVDAKYLMDRYGLQPGPEVGRLKRSLEDYSLEVDARDLPELCDKWDKR